MECGAEVTVEDGVDDWVKQRVDVAQPEHDAQQLGGVGASARGSAEHICKLYNPFLSVPVKQVPLRKTSTST